jgi:hypothetical protein
VAAKPSIVASLQAELESQRERYKTYLNRRCESGNFFHFFRDYLKVMTLEEAVVLQSIVNMGRGNSDSTGWIPCTADYLHKTLNIGRRCRDRAVSGLEEKEYLETKLSGVPAKKYVRVDLIRVEEAIDSVCTQVSKLDCPPVGQTGLPTGEQHKEKKTSSSKTKRGKGSVAPRPSPAPSGEDGGLLFSSRPSARWAVLPCHLANASRLRDYFTQQKSSFTSQYNRQKWGRNLQTFADSVGSDRLQTVLDYLLQHHTGRPKIVSVEQFTTPKMFEWLADEMDKRCGTGSDTVATSYSREHTVATSPEDQKLVAEILRLDWPMSKLDRIKPTVLAAARESIRNLTAYAEWARSVTVKKHDLFREKVVKELAGWDGPRRDAIVVHWFRLVAAEVADWDRWQGDLRKLFLHHTQKMFDKFWSDGMGLPPSELPRFKEEVRG